MIIVLSCDFFQNRIPDRALYKAVFVTNTSWSQTKAFCRKFGYFMTTIHSFEELQTIHDWLTYQGSWGPLIYIGLQLISSQQVAYIMPFKLRVSLMCWLLKTIQNVFVKFFISKFKGTDERPKVLTYSYMHGPLNQHFAITFRIMAAKC